MCNTWRPCAGTVAHPDTKTGGLQQGLVYEYFVFLLAVALALPLDVHKICDTGLINKDWQERAPNKSVVCESHVAIVSRKGNPKNVKSWSDLTR